MAGVRIVLRSTLCSPEENLYFLHTFQSRAMSVCADDGWWGLTTDSVPFELHSKGHLDLGAGNGSEPLPPVGGFSGIHGSTDTGEVQIPLCGALGLPGTGLPGLQTSLNWPQRPFLPPAHCRGPQDHSILYFQVL